MAGNEDYLEQYSDGAKVRDEGPPLTPRVINAGDFEQDVDILNSHVPQTQGKMLYVFKQQFSTFSWHCN